MGSWTRQARAPGRQRPKMARDYTRWLRDVRPGQAPAGNANAVQKPSWSGADRAKLERALLQVLEECFEVRALHRGEIGEQGPFVAACKGYDAPIHGLATA